MLRRRFGVGTLSMNKPALITLDPTCARAQQDNSDGDAHFAILHTGCAQALDARVHIGAAVTLQPDQPSNGLHVEQHPNVVSSVCGNRTPKSCEVARGHRRIQPGLRAPLPPRPLSLPSVANESSAQADIPAESCEVVPGNRKAHTFLRAALPPRPLASPPANEPALVLSPHARPAHNPSLKSECLCERPKASTVASAPRDSSLSCVVGHSGHQPPLLCQVTDSVTSSVDTKCLERHAASIRCTQVSTSWPKLGRESRFRVRKRLYALLKKTVLGRIKRPSVIDEHSLILSRPGELCNSCQGRGHRGILGWRGFGVVNVPCVACDSTGREKYADTTMERSFAPDLTDQLTTPKALVAGGIVVGTLTVACMVTGVGIGLLPILVRAYEAANTLGRTLGSVPYTERWATNLATYVKATSGTLERIRTLVDDDQGSRCEALCTPLCQIAELLERLNVLIRRYMVRNFLAKAYKVQRFHGEREEIMAALGLWNSSLTQGLQLLNHDALTAVAIDLKTLARASPGHPLPLAT